MCLLAFPGPPFKTRLLTLLFWISLAATAAAQVTTQRPSEPANPNHLPDSPLPVALASPGLTREAPPPVHAFWDKTNLRLFAGIAVLRGLDYASTRNMQARGREEILLPDEVVNNSAGFAALEAAATVTSVGISYALHRIGHHRMERWLSIGHISVTGFGVVRNYSLESHHPAPATSAR